MSDLIDAGTMRSLVELDTTAMPGLCTIYRREMTETATGGSKRSEPIARNATPLRCRVTPRNLQRSWTVVAATVASPAEVDISVEIAGFKAQGVEIALTDLIEVTTTLRNPGGDDVTSTTRYRVAGKPVYGSYSTNIAIPAAIV